MTIAARPIAAELAELTPLWARESALDHRNLLIADAPERRLAAADALAVETARTAARVAIAVPDADAVDARLEALRARDLGELRLVGASQRVHADDRAVVRGSFDLLVISIQRLGDLLTRAPQLAESLGLVIVDGVEALVDPTLSCRWDRPLTLLRASALPPRIVALAAADAPEATIARWLDAAIERAAEQLDLTVASVDAIPELPLEPVLVQMTVTGRVGHAGELRRMLLMSFAGHACYRRLSAAGDAREGFSLALDAAIERCMDAGVITYRTGHGLVATEAGRLAVSLGLDVATIEALDRWVRSLGAAPPSLLELSLELARTPAGQKAPLPAGGSQDYRAQALDSARALGVAGRPVFRWLAEELWSFGPTTEVALRQAALLHGLLHEQRRDDLQGHHRTSPALLRGLAATFARPLLAVVALCRQHGRPAAEADALFRAARRLDSSVTDVAARPLELRTRTTPPKPTITRGPATSRGPATQGPRSRRRPRTTPPRTAQVTLFAE
ncbi:MAG: hypothetical protein KC486_28600 [Myxococcales bacterium]|nr:hypothetical protein [Myxococcales bacterium]